MDESRKARQPKKPDNNELWSWIVIALLFAFAWPVGLIVLFAKLSDSNKRKKNRAGAQQTIITAEPEDAATAAAAPTAAEKKKSDSAAQSKKRKSSITRTPKISDSNANVLRNIGLVVTVIGAIILLNALGDNLFFLEYGNWRAFLEYTFWPMGITAGGLGLLLGSHWMRRRLRRYAKYQAIAGKKPTVTISQLAAAADVSPRRVENDLEQMVQKGFWGKEAYLDLGRGVLVRTFEAAEGLEPAQKETQPAPAEAERAVICSLDADSPVEPDYFERVREFFAARTEREAGAAVIGFRHRAGESAEQESAIRAYERYLDRYAEKLTRAGSPYGFRTVGSAFAVRASTYVRCGGMRVRTAGEDFYFLQAAAKVAPMGRMDEVLVHPSPRCSERVPFGTGRSVRSILEGGTLREIPDEAFDGLRELLRWASDPVRLASVSEVPDRARAFLEREGFFEIWPKVLRNTPPREEARAAAFHRWFDGLRTLRYLHFLAGWR
mgnify:CR=1 FL=1